MEVVTPRAVPDRLAAYESLLVGQALISTDNQFSFVLQVDGNAVIYCPWGSVWANYSTSGRSTVLAMQADGNVVIRGPANEVVWDTGTSGHPGSVLIMQNDGNLVLYENWTPVWARGTGWY